MKRLFAWVVLGGVAYVVYGAVASFQSPWPTASAPASPVLQMLPVAPAGCAGSKDCFHD